MKLKKLPIELNDDILDLEWLSNSKQPRFVSSKKTLDPVEFVLQFDEINALVSNLPFNQNKSAEKKEAATIKEFALISNPFYLCDTEEEEILELDASFNYSYV